MSYKEKAIRYTPEQQESIAKMKILLIALGLTVDHESELLKAMQAAAVAVAQNHGTPDKMYMSPQILKALKKYNDLK